MQELQANTEVKVRIGPFIDVTDYHTPETGVTLTGGGDNADEAELLKHNGAATVDLTSPAATWAAVSGCDGWYDLTLTAAHTDTEGQLTVVVQNDSEYNPVYRDFMVISQAAWASKYGDKDTGYMDINVKAVAADVLGVVSPHLMQTTTIATLASQVSFTLTAGSADDDALNGCTVRVTDSATGTQRALGMVADYAGATKTVTLDYDPGIFTMAVGDTIDIFAGQVNVKMINDSNDAAKSLQRSAAWFGNEGSDTRDDATTKTTTIRNFDDDADLYTVTFAVSGSTITRTWADA